jgi:glycosyltransferase involved in cell wall biosynthesis
MVLPLGSSEARVLLVDDGCRFISGKVKDILLRRGFGVETIDMGSIGKLDFKAKIAFLLSLAAELWKKTYSSILLCTPASTRLAAWLLFLLFTGPSKIVIVVSPSTKHGRPIIGFLDSALLSLASGLLRMRGKKIMIVYTTPYEKMLFEKVFSIDSEAVYHPYGVVERRRAPSMLRDNPPVLFVYSVNEYAAKWIPGAVLFLEELGVRPLIILGLEDPVGKCPGTSLMACIHSDDYDSIIRDSTIVVLLHASPESNLILSRAVSYGRPVIAHPSIGMSHVYSGTGLVVFEETPGPETLATKILKIINSLDNYRRLGLSIKLRQPSEKYLAEALADFLRE